MLSFPVPSIIMKDRTTLLLNAACIPAHFSILFHFFFLSSFPLWRVCVHVVCAQYIYIHIYSRVCIRV